LCVLSSYLKIFLQQTGKTEISYLTAVTNQLLRHSAVFKMLKQLRPIGKGDQELEKRLDQKELT
jgi:hypothetical protein